MRSSSGLAVALVLLAGTGMLFVALLLSAALQLRRPSIPSGFNDRISGNWNAATNWFPPVSPVNPGDNRADHIRPGASAFTIRTSTTIHYVSMTNHYSLLETKEAKLSRG